MATIERMQAVLQSFTSNEETIAEFCEAAAGFYKPGTSDERRMREAAREIRRRKFVSMRKEDYVSVLCYDEEHHFLTPSERRDIARRQCEKVLYDRPWEALEMARKFDLQDIAQHAARRYSEHILANPGMDVSAAIEIARREREADTDYRTRAARHAFGEFIRHRDFGKLPALVTEFRTIFADEEAELASFLAHAEKERQERRLGKP